ncbi:ATP-binding protein [Prosthecochloris sp. GSB1]|uniref:ABC transporter ATP-binding protein n=1 Tax=Prosthecochloris sp. GSB1 TaxID=281093 RepID=UPI000B8CC798|nr:ABC transporter ATP-binding protein [Prosthecochloris sp. GSB1]ASQ89786.1 ATP-binding protein [Prosthecochloris sp. GSB1]
MIVVENVSKRYKTRAGFNTVLDGISLRIEKGEKLGILGRNGSGKSTLIRLLGGVEQPDRGRIIRGMSVSWPLAFSGAFQGSLTGIDNLRFICRVYGTSVEDKIPQVKEFSELGRYLREPVKTYSSGMKARLAFALSMAIEFDCYLIDEVTAVGDSRFHDKCRYELHEKRSDRSIILVSHNPKEIRRHCDIFYVLKRSGLRRFDDADEAYNYYQRS